MIVEKLTRNGVIITTNPLNHEGGVVAFYNLLLKRFNRPEFSLAHLSIGSRMMLFHSPLLKRLIYPIQYIADLVKLVLFLLRHPAFRIVQINPSLIPIPLIRDGIILLVALILNCKVVVFFHGWKVHVLNYLKSHPWAKWLFVRVYRKASMTLVLASRFKEDLIALGWDSSSVHVTTTMYEEESILPPVVRTGKRPRFLFLGRISQLKGIDEFIKAAKTLYEQGYDFECIIVGHGDRKGVVEEYVKRSQEYGLQQLFHFTGRLTGKEKYQEYAQSDIYVFPSWTEGCPTSVLEALGTGLFVISTDVGALRDIIREDENGKIVRCKDTEHLAELMKWGCDNIELIRIRRESIQKDANIKYEAGIIVAQFSSLYERLIHG